MGATETGGFLAALIVPLARLVSRGALEGWLLNRVSGDVTPLPQLNGARDRGPPGRTPAPPGGPEGPVHRAAWPDERGDIRPRERRGALGRQAQPLGH